METVKVLVASMLVPLLGLTSAGCGIAVFFVEETATAVAYAIAAIVCGLGSFLLLRFTQKGGRDGSYPRNSVHSTEEKIAMASKGRFGDGGENSY